MEHQVQLQTTLQLQIHKMAKNEMPKWQKSQQFLSWVGKLCIVCPANMTNIHMSTRLSFTSTFPSVCSSTALTTRNAQHSDYESTFNLSGGAGVTQHKRHCIVRLATVFCFWRAESRYHKNQRTHHACSLDTDGWQNIDIGHCIQLATVQ